MSVIDPHAEKLHKVFAQMKTAPTFEDFLRLQYERYELDMALAQARAELARVSRGWVFVPPGKPPS